MWLAIFLCQDTVDVSQVSLKRGELEISAVIVGSCLGKKRLNIYWICEGLEKEMWKNNWFMKTRVIGQKSVS